LPGGIHLRADGEPNVSQRESKHGRGLTLIDVRHDMAFPNENWNLALPESQGLDSTTLARAARSICRASSRLRRTNSTEHSR
jgi:hypothetical protein